MIKDVEGRTWAKLSEIKPGMKMMCNGQYREIVSISQPRRGFVTITVHFPSGNLISYPYPSWQDVHIEQPPDAVRER